jgi:hypothetical protein
MHFERASVRDQESPFRDHSLRQVVVLSGEHEAYSILHSRASFFKRMPRESGYAKKSWAGK